MENLIVAILTSSLMMSGVIIGLILFNKLFSGKYSAKWRYYIWLIVLIGLIIPFRPNITLPFEPVRVSVTNTEQPILNNSAERHTYENSGLQLSITESALGSDTRALSKASVIFIVWLTGVVFAVAFRIRCHGKFTGMVNRWAEDITDGNLLFLLEQVKSDLNITRNVGLKKCLFITSPMLAGFIKPVILLPDRLIHEDELLLVLKHELIHCKRGDLWVNLLVVAATAVHWFNPFVYIMASAVRNDCEVSCDEAVLGGTGIENRRIYGETIIGFIGTKKAVRTALTTNFYGGKNTMKKRIISMMKTGRKNRRFAVLCAVLVLASTLMSGSVLAAGNSIIQPAITPEQSARAIALAEAGGGVVIEFERDTFRHNGVRVSVYEIKIINGTSMYDIKIGIADSVIYSSRVSASKKAFVFPANLITPEKAEEIALARVGGGVIDEWELELKKGVWIYEVEVKYNRTEYDIEINAMTGDILKFKIDD